MHAPPSLILLLSRLCLDFHESTVDYLVSKILTIDITEASGLVRRMWSLFRRIEPTYLFHFLNK
jgi:hypothetical protein